MKHLQSLRSSILTRHIKGTITVTAGLGGKGGVQLLVLTMNGGVCIAIEVDESRIDR